MDIIVSGNNNETVMTLPVVLDKMPKVVQSYNNETFQTLDGEISLIGNKNLRTVSISSFFPVNKNYKIRPNADKNGWNYVYFFNKYAGNKMPIRMIWLNENGQEISNLAYTVEQFETQINLVGDIEYTLELKEYRFINA